MARQQRVTVKGMDELARKLDQLPRRIEAGLQAAVRDETTAVADDMRRNAPRGETGELIRSIQAEVTSDGLTGTAAATARYATFVEHGTSDTPAQPFAQPAAERSRGRFVPRIRDAVGDALADLTR